MMGGAKANAQTFQGFDLMTMESGENPLIASYIGAPYQVRGTDPADYGRAARDYLTNGGPGGAVGTAATAAAGALPGGIGVAAGAMAGMATGGAGSWWDNIKVGVSGVMVGLVLVTLGVAYFLWGD